MSKALRTLARTIIELRTKPYDNETCDADNLAFDAAAVALAKAVAGDAVGYQGNWWKCGKCGAMHRNARMRCPRIK